MDDAIGSTAGTIWRTLNNNGELSLAQLKKEVNGKTPVFDWSIGWLAREGKIAIVPEKHSYKVRLTNS